MPPDASLEILHQDVDFLVLNKPAGLVCHPSKQGPLSSLVGRLRQWLGAEAKPHLVNRLDRETSGLVLVACHPNSARELRRLWEQREALKEYLAVVHGRPNPSEAEINEAIGPALGSAVAIRGEVRPDGAPSKTRYRVERGFRRAGSDFSLLRVWPETGRKHQIRIHLSHIGHPLVGDKIYGGDERMYLDFVAGRQTEAQRAALLLPHQALHAAALRFRWRAREWEFTARPEPWFEEFIGPTQSGRAISEVQL